jgi:hypothetical protein
MLMLDKLRDVMDEFDILHFHIDQFHFPLFRPIANRTLTTLHGRQDLPDLQALYRGFSDMPLVSISDAQRQPVSTAGFVKTVYHGIPLDLHRPSLRPRGGYLAFLGRICPEKRPDRAITIARASGIPPRSRPRLTTSTKHTSTPPLHRFSMNPKSALLEKSMSRQRLSFSVKRSPCSFQSSGRSHLDSP